MWYGERMTPKRAPGRPRSSDVDTAILDAAAALLSDGGPANVSINAVARRSGVARASIYLRYPGRNALVAAAVRASAGIPPFPLSGDVDADLRRAARQAQAILANPAFRTVLPAIVAGLLRQRGGADPISIDVVAPNRLPIADEYERLAKASGLRTDIDPDLPASLIVGSMLWLLLATGVPPSVEDADQVAEIILAGLRAAEPIAE